MSVLTAVGQTAVTVQEGTEVKEVFNATALYKYPEFYKGEVHFKDGAHSKARLNYNLLLGEMQFVDPKGDTLSVANETIIKFIAINADTFYFQKEYLQLLTADNPVKLAMNERLTILDKERFGAYDQRVPANSVTSYSSIVFGNNFTKLSIKQVVDLKLKKTYYLGDKYNNFTLLNKKNLIKRFSNYQNKIEDYLNQSTPNFNDIGDVTKLVKFLQQL